MAAASTHMNCDNNSVIDKKERSVRMNVDLATFASVARARGSSQLQKPNCLNFQTKDNIKRMEALELLKKY